MISEKLQKWIIHYRSGAEETSGFFPVFFLYNGNRFAGRPITIPSSFPEKMPA